MTKTQRAVMALMTAVSNQSMLPYLAPFGIVAVPVLEPFHIVATPAFAGTSVITVKDAANATQTFDVITDGSGRFGAMSVICDGLALATCAQLGTFGTTPSAVPALNSNSYITNLNANGQTTMANAAPVVISSDQTAVKVQPGTTAASWGVGATGAAVPVNAPYVAALARSSENSTATSGNLTGVMLDLVGKVITSPYANRENMIRATATASSTAAVTLIGAQGAGVKTYVTNIECGRTDTGTTAMTLTLSDAQSTVLIIPNNGGGGGNNYNLTIPLVTAANTTLSFTPGTAVNTTYCNVQAFTGY